MRMTLLVHVLAGTLGLVAGYFALFATKGGTLHRKSGLVFVVAMVVMTVGGLAIAVGRSVAPEINVPAALLTFYLVVTALTTVKPLPLDPSATRWVHVAGLLIAVGIATTMTAFSVEAFANGGRRQEMPAFPFVLFATAAVLGAVGDLRVLRSGALKGGARLARHLWRMSFGLFIAALSFAVQAAKILSRSGVTFPGVGVLVALPILVALVAMFYWLWRVRARKSLRGVVTIRTAEAV